ncbi:MAG: ribosomal protection-like ABC-F family protein [Halothermotrichaceae bacterium]
MSIVNINKIKKSYGITEVLTDFSLYVTAGERVGLIGANGSGKTTLFKIIAGIESYDGGTLALKRSVNVGYLSQMPDFKAENTLIEELKTVFNSLIVMEKELRKLEAKISQNSQEKQNNNRTGQLMQEYSELQHKFEIKGGYRYQSKIKEIAHGMGFGLKELENKVVGSLSGGEKTRLGLVKLLLTEPDLLLLDEPTNHLDLPSIQWLEEYLNNYQGTVIIISHDRYFLDEVITRIVEIKNGSEETYQGNYSYYLEERRRRFERQKKAYENQQKKIKKMEEAIERLHRWGQQGDNNKFFKRAKSMQKSLEKIDEINKPTLDGKQMQLSLDVEKRSGREVVKISGLDKTFGELKLLENLELNIYWGEKIAVIGENGSGKTTLIKILLDQIKPNKGEVRLGANVKLGYYSQEFEGFNPEDTLVQALRNECRMTNTEARNALAAFLFTENEVFKKVKDLSGGEKSRLRLLQLMNGDYNFLVLDEPTNHLDLPSREILEEVLQDYPGTIMVVSHDRYFLNKIIDYTYELKNLNLTRYHGNYDYYRKKKEQLKELESSDSTSNKNDSDKKSNYHLLKEEIKKERKRKNDMKKIEAEIEEREEILIKLENNMVEPDNLNDISLLNDLKIEYEKIKKEVNMLYKQWEKLMEEG